MNREFRLFIAKNMAEILNFLFVPPNILTHYRRILYATAVTRIQGVVLRRIGGHGHSGHVTKMAVTTFDPQFPKTPCYTQTSRLYLL